jgi:hypothetical protein
VQFWLRFSLFCPCCCYKQLENDSRFFIGRQLVNSTIVNALGSANDDLSIIYSIEISDQAASLLRRNNSTFREADMTPGPPSSFHGTTFLLCPQAVRMIMNAILSLAGLAVAIPLPCHVFASMVLGARNVPSLQQSKTLPFSTIVTQFST